MPADQDAPTLLPDPAGDIEKQFRATLETVERRLTGAMQPTPVTQLRSLVDEAELLADPRAWDRYGELGPIEQLEQQVAQLLGKPAAAVFPSGVMAQQCVLRVWTDARRSPRVALPALSHLLHHEADGPQLLHGFQYERLTDGPSVPVPADLERIPGRLGAALLELPLRDAGYLLPTWQELSDFSSACRARDVPLHFDGARIWESQPYLGHSLAEIADLADTVYVSFYKGLLGLAGAAVAGPCDVIAEARQWRTRHGGTIYTLLPYALAALRGLRDELPMMAQYHQRAAELAEAMTGLGLRVHPDPPHTNAFRVLVAEDSVTVNQRLVAYMRENLVGLTPPWLPADVPGWSWTEFTVGRSTLDWSVKEAAELLHCTVTSGWSRS